jgi:hypothetical protein
VSNDVSGLRVTVWPGSVLAVPDVSRLDVLGIDGAGNIWYDHASLEQVQPPPELFLRELLALDVEDPDALVDFVHTNGQIVHTWFTPPHVAVKVREWIPYQPVHPRSWSHYPVEDVACWLKTAQTLTKHWLAHVVGEDPMPAWAGFSHTKNPDDAWGWFVDLINLGLQEFQVRVERPIVDANGAPVVDGAPRPDLYDILCLQLANHIAEEATFRRCENEACGQVFFRQRGRAGPAGQYRTEGVMYCSKSCAHSQAQRALRRRNRKGSK